MSRVLNLFVPSLHARNILQQRVCASGRAFSRPAALDALVASSSSFSRHMLLPPALLMPQHVWMRGKRFPRFLSSITAEAPSGAASASATPGGAASARATVEEDAKDCERLEVVEEEERAGHRAMGWWLMGCSAMVAGMVVLGGVTRLTGSGLSMVKWRPTGILPPKDQAGWEKEFEEFKQYPEWIMKRQYEDFGVEDFKWIWYMEWTHRMAGRAGI